MEDIVAQIVVVYYVVTALEVVKVIKLLNDLDGALSFARWIVVIKVFVLGRLCLHNLLFVLFVLALLLRLRFFFIFEHTAATNQLLTVLECLWVASAPA